MGKYRQATLRMNYIGDFANERDAHRQIKHYIYSMSKEQFHLTLIRIIEIDFYAEPPLVTFTIPANHIDAFDSYIKRGKVTVLKVDK